eukprot:2077177-Pleurochrysis_carterae.AAC.3
MQVATYPHAQHHFESMSKAYASSLARGYGGVLRAGNRLLREKEFVRIRSVPSLAVGSVPNVPAGTGSLALRALRDEVALQSEQFEQAEAAREVESPALLHAAFAAPPPPPTPPPLASVRNTE